MKKSIFILFCVQWLAVSLCAQYVDGSTMVISMDTLSYVSIDAPPVDTVVADSLVVHTSSQDTLLQWRDYRDTRKELRTGLRSERTFVRSEMHQMRDSVRKATFAEIDAMPHEIRIGWGDMMFEGLIWHETPSPNILPEDYTATYNENYRYTQHCFVEYLYHMNYWYSVGGMVDYSAVLWDAVTRDGKGQEISRQADRLFHNIVLMPIVHFSYLHSEYISLYSALGLGLNINTGTELDYRGRHTAVAPAANISLLGVRVGKKHFFGAIELGGMISLASTNEIYMLGSRIFTASIGARF